MCTRNECFEKVKKAAPYISETFGVTSLCIFGSMARGDNKKGSDVDVCVEMPPKAFKVLALKNFLQELLGTAVDLIRRHSNMDTFLLDEIEKDGIYIISHS